MARSRTLAQASVITDARVAASDDIERRQKRYLVTMTIRTACFVGMYFIDGLGRWLLLLGAALLPAIAVIGANARDNRSEKIASPLDEDPHPIPMLGSGAVIPGELHEESPAHRA